MQNFHQQFQTPLSQKQKTFSWFFISCPEYAWNLEPFQKKTWVSQPNYFRNYLCRKTWLLKRLKGLASEHHSLMNVLTSSKHCGNQRGTTITLFSRQFEVNSVGKSHPQSYMRSKDCLLTHWMPMTGILAAICRIYGNNFKRQYLRNKGLFLDFSLPFWNVHEN